jgi:hypothetical protein
VADVNSNIGINFDTTAALASLRKLQAGLSTFNQSLTQGNVAAMNAQKGLNSQLIQAINATGKFVASQKEIATSTGSFTQALEKNQLSMRQYFRYTAAAATANTKTFKGMFAQEREIINRARKDRVKLLQSQYIQLGNANGDLVKVLQVVPKHLQMANGKYADYTTRVQMAAQRQQFLNQLLKQGSTNLLNFGKNTQWAGRQLMVGLTIPLSILGSAAAKTFMEMEEAVLKFTRVYGDITTSGDATNKAVADIQRLGKEFTKYGIAVKDTMEMAATAAAMGMQGSALEAQVVQATRLSVLGQVEQQQALETTISLQNAFGVSSEDLAQKINFLNAVENQTVLSIEDLTIAIPKAGPVVKQLGGDVEDLAFFMTAMKEGGINASEGANALKSGLASMINPAKKTSEFLAGLGINIKGIVDNNAGNLKGTVVGLARALDTLDPLNRARAIEQLFGKFQFARMSTLFQNVAKDGTQASRALDLAGASIEELAILSERELARVENSTGAKFKKAMENLKNELVPVGKAFLQAVTPIVEFVGKILTKFNGLSDGTKKVITIMIGVLGAIAPVALMTFGVLVNGIANVIKFFAMLRGGIAKLNGQNNVLGGGFDYLTNQQTELLAETNALHTSHQQLLSTFNVEKTAVDALALAYGNAASQARALASSSPGLFNSVPGPAGAVAGLPKYAKGKKSDVVTVGGTGNQDSELALLTPGETVISAPMSDKYGVLINAMIDDKIPGYMASKRSQTAGQSSPGVGFNVGGQMLSLPIKPESDRNIKAITNIVKAMETGALDVENGLEVVEEVFARFALDSEIDLKNFVAELRIATLAMRDVELESDNINKVSGVVTGDKDKVAGHSKSEAEGKNKGKTLQDDMEAIGQGDEYDRTQKIADETSDYIDSLGLKPLQRPGSRKATATTPAVKGKHAQLDRGHVATLGPTVKSLEEGWARDFWDPQEHEENALSEALTIKQDPKTGEDKPNVVRDRYMQALDAIKASEQQQAQSGDALIRAAAERKLALAESIEQKIILNGALNEEELQVQAEVLDEMLNDTAFMAEETTGKKGNKGTVATPGFKRTAEAARKDAELRLKYPSTLPPDLRTPEERVASGMVGVTKRFGKRNEEGVDPSRGFVPLSDAEKARRLESIDRGPAPTIEVTEEDKAKAAEEGAKVGAAAADGVRSTNGTDADSPSKKGIKAGKEVADGIVQGMKEGEAAVTSQSSRLGDAAVPEEAINEKMDVGNKAFYDDLDNPEDYEERQILKSEDRQRRKLGAERARVGKTDTDNKAFYDDIDTPEMRDERQVLKSLDRQRRKRSEGTDDIAGSTLLVADQTDELATVTGDAVSAQTTNTDNLITTGQLTNAANNNLGEMLPVIDRTGVAQQDLATSSGNIAVVNDEIEAEKREQLAQLKAYNAQEAARMAAENGIVPPGSQSGNEELGKNRMGSVAAYEEASTYTRDKNGQILFDPELDADGKKQPTTLSEKQIGQKKRGMRREKVGKFSGKVSGAAGTAAMVAGMAGAPPQVTAALGGVATVAQFAPMLAGMTGPQGIVVALAAVAAGAYLFNKHLNAMAGKAAQFAKDLSATRSGLKAIGEVSGKVGSSEIMDKRRSKSQYGKYDEAVKINDVFGKQFLGSDAGKKEKALFQQNVKDFGKDKAISDLSLKLSTAVADGVLDSDAANSIAAAMAIDLNDAKIEMQVIGQMSSLIGPDGEDLKKDPMKARIAIMAKAGQRTGDLETQIASKSGFGESSRKEVAALAALNMNNLELATMMADQVQVEYETQKKKLEAELAATTNAQKKLDLEKQISTLNAQNLKDSQFMNDNIAAQINKNAISFSKVYSGSVWGKQAMREDAYFDASKAQVESTYKGTDQEAAAKSFLNKTQALGRDTTTGKYNSSTGQYVKTGLGTQENAQKFQAKMEMLVGSKVLSPGEATSYMDLFSGKLNEMDFLLNAGIKTKGTAKTKELFGMFSGFSASGRKQATSIITEMIMKKKNPAEFDSIMETLKSVQSMDGNTLDFEVLIKTVGLEGIELIKKEQEALEKMKEDAKKAGKDSLVSADGKSVDATADVSGNMKAATDALEGNEERMAEFKKGSLEQQTEYLQKLAAQMMYEATVNDKTREADIQFLAEQQAMNEAYLQGIAIGSDKYVEILAKNVAALKLLSDGDFAVKKVEMVGTGGVTSLGADVPKTTGDGGGKKPLDFLDALAMRIKNVRDGAFDATKPLESMLAAFSNPKIKKDMNAAFKVFDGLQQRMIDMKIPKEFRDMIAGMSAEEFNDIAKLTGKKAIFKFKKGKPKTKANIEGLTDTGKKTMKTYNEAIVGEGNVVNREAVEQVQNQEAAFKILISEGASATEALEHVQDAALAASIAAGALGKKGSKERKQYIEDLKKATDETERFALRQKMIQANEEFKLLEQMPKLGTAMKVAGFSADQMQEVLNDPALAKSLIEDLKDGKVDSKEIADYLNSIEARKMIDIQVNYNSGKYSESAQPGMDLVDEMFSVQENMLRTGADPRTKAMVDTFNANDKAIKAAELSAKGFRHEIEIINRSIANAEREIEMNYTRPIEEMQEQISDKQRILEMDPEFGDRAMEEINKVNSIMSNDSAIMANQAEKINEEYDKQAEALEKVAQINEEITNQQKSQLDIAGALTSGDIAAAARAAQDARAQSAQRFGTATADALQQSRENEISGLRGAETGLSQKEIDQAQFDNSQRLYEMETDPRRTQILEDIRLLEDEIYKKEELREAALLAIRVQEDEIYRIQKTQLEPLENKIADLGLVNEKIQAEIDLLVEGITVLDKTKLEWDRIKATIDANALAGKDFDGVLGALLASAGKIADKWDSILAKLKEYNSTPVAVKDAQTKIETNAATAAASVAADNAAANAVTGATTDTSSTPPGKAWISDGKGGWKKPPKPVGDYGWSDTNGWVKGYAGADTKGSTDSAAEAKLRADALARTSAANAEAAARTLAARQADYDSLMAGVSRLRADGDNGLANAAMNRITTKYPGGRPSKLAKGGLVDFTKFLSGGFSIGQDVVPAMLAPGEFVMSKYAVDTHGINTMKSLNNGESVGGAVYNNTYTLTVNARTDANPNEIAQAVMSTIRNVEGRRVRGVSLND